MNSAEKQAVLHCLKSMIDEEVCEECPLYGMTGTDHCEKDCIRLAINALEQEPCEDAISRQNAIDAIENYHIDATDIDSDTEDSIKFGMATALNIIQQLPPVTPAEKVGQWTPVNNKLPEEDSEVLITLQIKSDYGITSVVEQAHFYDCEWHDSECCLDDDKDFSVLAWMPLPDVYRASPTGAESEE